MAQAKDVDMKDAKEDKGDKKDEAKKELSPEEKAKEALALLHADLKTQLLDLDKTALTKEPRFQARVIRQLKSTRKRITADVLRDVVSQTFPADSATAAELLGFLAKHTSQMEISKPADGSAAESPKPVTREPSPEVAVYLHLLIVIHLIDKKQSADAVNASAALVKKVQPLTRRTMSTLASKAYFYYSRAYELNGHLQDIRPTLLAAYRTATLRHDDEVQATVLNLLLRNYLEYNLYDQADKLVLNSTFKESSTSNNQFARYLYYQGRIKAIQLEYSDAYKFLLQAVRKAPQSGAKGFRSTAYKNLAIVQLLLGEIPERSIFRQPGLKKQLAPYLQLTQAVNVGNLDLFQKTLTTYGNQFKEDKVWTLIIRLRHNVIKTGLRKINLAYSRIHFTDICKKLHLDSVADAEYIVAKAIRDGVIDATINREGGYVQSREQGDTYATAEPLEAFHKRIEFCLNVHNEAVRAMRFHPEAGKTDAADEEARRERQKAEAEIANSLEKEDDDF